MKTRIAQRLFVASMIAAVSVPCRAADSQLEALASAKNNRDAAELVQELQADDETQLLDVLGTMKDKSPVVKNWLLSVAQSVADRDSSAAMEQLNQFLPRLSEDATARYWAFTYVTRDDEGKRRKLLESMLADPSLDLRYEAVAMRLADLDENGKDAAKSDDQKVALYRELLAAARLPEQIQGIASKLEELEQPVDLLEHFGFVSDWNFIGTFDNVDQGGFDVVYGPEEQYSQGGLNQASKFTGKNGEAQWKSGTTEEADGALDVAGLFDKEKGALIYAMAEFHVPAETPCEVRIGTPNACKVWVNQELAISREVYHSGNQIDQYTAPVTLQPGKNIVFIKLCQNEQKESWAQDWLFQLRFTDETGYAIQSSK